MISAARRVAFDLLCKVENEGLFSDDAVNSAAVARLEDRDRRLATELIMGTLRWQGLLDFVLARSSSRPWPEVDAPVRVLLRMSLHQLWQMDRIPDHAVVNDGVDLAKRVAGIGAGGFVNAILRKLAKEQCWRQDGFLALCPSWDRISLPRWLWIRWARRFGEAPAHEYAMSLLEAPRMTLRVPGERAVSTGDEIPAGLEPSDLVPGAFFPKQDRKDAPGAPFPGRIQDEASQLVAHLPGSVEGLRVWDACAAPGGKSAIFLEDAGHAGFVLSSDVSPARARLLARNLSRAPGGRSAVVILDAREAPPFRGSFDAAVADVPCSGLGTLRRNPEIKWRLRPEQLAPFRETQKAILDSVSRAVRPGGLLLYSTCSTEPEENEEVVQGFLSRNPEFTVTRPAYPPGVEALLDDTGFLRTFPGTRLWDGFFAALMRRASGH